MVRFRPPQAERGGREAAPRFIPKTLWGTQRISPKKRPGRLAGPRVWFKTWSVLNVIRIIDGLGRSDKHPAFDLSTATAFEGKSADWYKVKAYDLGNGQIEATASRGMVWQEQDWEPSVIVDYLAAKDRHLQETEEERGQRYAEQSARRAKKRVRHLCKAMGTDSLLTLTYRALMTDLDRCKAHVKEFNRRLKRWLPGFQFVAGFEQQKRGAWHVHIATAGIPNFFMEGNRLGVPCKVKSYDLLRRIWRAVVGDLGGNVDLSRRKAKGSRCAAIAAYIAKYITKEFAEGEKWSNRYAKYGACEVPLPVDLGVFANLQEAIEAAFSVVMPEQQVNRSFLPYFKDYFFVSAEPPPS